jgi:hypothetical protein
MQYVPTVSSKGAMKNRSSSVSSSPELHNGNEKLIPMFWCFLLSMFHVFNLSDNNNHANTLSLGHKLDFQIHIKGARGSVFLN